MKKFAKLSLVAAVAVAGITSANAGSLEEAIKNVDISGTATYRYDDRTLNNVVAEGGNNDVNNSYKIAVNLSSKINDDLKFNSRTVIGNGTTNMAGLDTNASDSEAAFALTQANFSYTGFANTTIIAGKQAVVSPFAVQADSAGDEDTGTGLVALVNVGAVTLGAAYYNNTNLEAVAGQDVAGLAVMANIGPVALDAWYLDILEDSTPSSGHNALSIGAKTKIAMVSLDARYSEVSHDLANTDKESLFKIGAKAKFGIIGVGAAFGKTNDRTGLNAASVTGVSLSGDADPKASMQGWGLNLEGADNATLIKTNVNVDVMTGLNVALNYNMKNNKDTVGAGSKPTETYAQLTYKMGKNFMTYVRLGEVDYDTNGAGDEGTRGRVHVQYSF